MSETTGIWTKSCCISKRLDGKLAIVTGSSAGIGLITAGELARRAEGARKQLLEKYGVNNPQSVNIDVACKDVTQSLSPIQNDQLIIEQLDLASLDSVRQFADRIKSKYTELNILINNAGLIVGKYEKTVDGFEMTMGVNHLGHFLLTELLLPLLKRSTPSRIIIVSSMAHYVGRLTKPDLQLLESEYSEMKAYNQSKLANVMHAVELSERLQNSGVTVVSAQTTLYTVLSDKLISGGYYSNCDFKKPLSIVKNKEEREWFWNRSCELLGIESQA
ncbi:unnamed protein product [Trichobilharzia regenti]|nr:unnamed protein product [Trichobilharzia regenti]